MLIMPAERLGCYHRRMRPTPPRIVLASASPRRRRLISLLGLEPTFVATDTPEDLTEPDAPEELACRLAGAKALAARGLTCRALLVMAFNTIVVHDGAMLASLSGRDHEVITGVALLWGDAPAPETFAVATPVTMRVLSETVVSRWIAAGEYRGCAGAYNIEHHLATVRDDACIANVAGLPACHLYARLRIRGVADLEERLVAPPEACDELFSRRCRLGPRLCAP